VRPAGFLPLLTGLLLEVGVADLVGIAPGYQLADALLSGALLRFLLPAAKRLLLLVVPVALEGLEVAAAQAELAGPGVDGLVGELAAIREALERPLRLGHRLLACLVLAVCDYAGTSGSRRAQLVAVLGVHQAGWPSPRSFSRNARID
jgi:hypothetical protein